MGHYEFYINQQGTYKIRFNDMNIATLDVNATDVEADITADLCRVTGYVTGITDESYIWVFFENEDGDYWDAVTDDNVIDGKLSYDIYLPAGKYKVTYDSGNYEVKLPQGKYTISINGSDCGQADIRNPRCL